MATYLRSVCRFSCLRSTSWQPCSSILRYQSSTSSSKADTPRARNSNPKLRKRDFDYCVDLVQNRDRESYLCGLLLPYEARRSYFAIRAWNVEVASIKDGSVSRQVGGAQFEESGASMALKIRVQWWRDALDAIYGTGTSSADHHGDEVLAAMNHSCWNNPVVRVLDHAVQERQLTKRFLERLLEAREDDLVIRQVETMNDAIDYADRTFSSLLYLSLETVKVREEAADSVAYHAGIGIGLTTALRGARIRLARGECSIPQELLSSFPYYKFNHEDPISDLSDDEHQLLRSAVQHMAETASSHLEQVRDLQSTIPKDGRLCFLPVVPALHYLSKLEKANYDIFDDKLLEQDHLTLLALLGRTWLTGVF